jgi:transcriptional regulator with XRE-family HTH domain
MTPKRNRSFSEELRRRILAADVSLGEISRRSGVAREVLSRFSRGLNGMSVPSIDAVFAALDLEVVGPEEKGRDKPVRITRRSPRG